MWLRAFRRRRRLLLGVQYLLRAGSFLRIPKFEISVQFIMPLKLNRYLKSCSVMRKIESRRRREIRNKRGEGGTTAKGDASQHTRRRNAYTRGGRQRLTSGGAARESAAPLTTGRPYCRLRLDPENAAVFLHACDDDSTAVCKSCYPAVIGQPVHGWQPREGEEGEERERERERGPPFDRGTRLHKS